MDPWQPFKDALAWLVAHVVVAALFMALASAVVFNLAYAYTWGVSAFPWPPHEKAWSAAAVVFIGQWVTFGLILKGWRALVAVAEQNRQAKLLEDRRSSQAQLLEDREHALTDRESAVSTRESKAKQHELAADTELQRVRKETSKSIAIGWEYQTFATNLRGILNDPKNVNSRTLAPIRKLLEAHDKNVNRIKDQDE